MFDPRSFLPSHLRAAFDASEVAVTFWRDSLPGPVNAEVLSRGGATRVLSRNQREEYTQHESVCTDCRILHTR